MAIVLEANYSKKLGLPGYSSHQYSITIKVELADINQVPNESGRLYSLLQSCVDREIQQTGFLPATAVPIVQRNGNGCHGLAEMQNHRIPAENWSCSEKQRELINKIVADNKLEKKSVEQLAQQRFSKGVRQLNKLEASGFIEELLEQNPGNNGYNRVRNQQKAGGR